MLTLSDGRQELWQWDTGRKLNVNGECTQVHFSNRLFGRSLDVDVVDGVVGIPDVLLQSEKEFTAWAFVGTPENGYTKISKVFNVNKRNKPADYVFTPPEQTTLAELVERLDAIEKSQDPDAIKNAVEDYLEQNPVEVPVQSVNGQTGEVKLTADDVGAVSQDGLQDATNEALRQAKESGEFDGEPGKTPVAGIDYFTDAEKRELAEYTAFLLSQGYKIPNPYSIKFTGAVSAEYDGSKEVVVKIPEGGGTGGSDSGRKLVAAIHYSNQQELTPTAIDPETGHITVAETVQADYWGGYCDEYFKFKVWEPSYNTANIPAKFLESNGIPYAIARIDDHTVGLMKGHGAWGDPYDVPASLDLSLFTLIGTTFEEMPPVEGLNLQNFDLEVWGNHIRPHIYLYDDAGATIPVSKKDMIDVYYEKNFYNHLTLHRRGCVITGTISIVDTTGTTNIKDLTFTIPPDAVVSKMQFTRRYSPASEMNIRIYEVNGGAAGE
jgi:hypothetical protein